MEIDIALINEVEDELELDVEIMYHELSKITVDVLDIDEDIELSVSMVDENKIQLINNEYRNIDKVTDVISFAMEDNQEFNFPGQPRCLGDIFICVQRAKEQANDYEHSLKRELAFLFVHGILHLLGYDHIDENDEVIMMKLQNEILDKACIGREL